MQATKYIKVFDIGLQNTFVYRWNFLLRALFGFVPLIGTVCIWRALFQSRGSSIGGYEFGSMIYYFLLTLLAENLITPTEDEWQIAADIREGQINSFLTKPLNYLGYRFTLFLSYRALYTVVTILPVALVFVWFRHTITLPAHALTWPLAALSLAMAAGIQFFIAYSLAMLATVRAASDIRLASTLPPVRLRLCLQSFSRFHKSPISKGLPALFGDAAGLLFCRRCPMPSFANC